MGNSPASVSAFSSRSQSRPARRDAARRAATPTCHARTVIANVVGTSATSGTGVFPGAAVRPRGRFRVRRRRAFLRIRRRGKAMVESRRPTPRRHSCDCAEAGRLVDLSPRVESVVLPRPQTRACPSVGRTMDLPYAFVADLTLCPCTAGRSETAMWTVSTGPGGRCVAHRRWHRPTRLCAALAGPIEVVQF
jgi:hypothetical protein